MGICHAGKAKNVQIFKIKKCFTIHYPKVIRPKATIEEIDADKDYVGKIVTIKFGYVDNLLKNIIIETKIAYIMEDDTVQPVSIIKSYDKVTQEVFNEVCLGGNSKMIEYVLKLAGNESLNFTEGAMYSATNGHADALEFLIKKKTFDLNPTLSRACLAGHKRSILVLLKHGADPNVRNIRQQFDISKLIA